MNDSEAIAKGCALQCAMLSPTFRVRDFGIQDISLYPIRVSWNAIEGDDMVVEGQE
jgi:molecular chaperone DnaK (HSP70)